MKTLACLLASISCAFAFAGTAHAVPVTVDGGISNYQLDAGNTAKNALSLTFDINAEVAKYYAASTDVTSAILNVLFSDPNNGKETYTISIAMNGQTVAPSGNNNVNNGGTKSESITFTTASLNDLKDDGIVTALIKATSGEFVVNSVALVAQVTEGVAPRAAVPEPASLALLVAGLCGLGAASRRRRG